MGNDRTIGAKIRELRLENKMTLRQLSELSGLSTGFLSQLERGMTSIAIDTLGKLAEIFDIGLGYFFDRQETGLSDPVMHGFNLRPNMVSDGIIQYILSHDKAAFQMLPRLFHLQPLANADDALDMYRHEGEEFIYVLEGIVTVYMENRTHTLYPGDSLHISSNVNHNWINQTGKPARLLSINCPNPFLKDAGEPEDPNRR